MLAILIISFASGTDLRAEIRFESPTLTQLAGGAPTYDWRARLSVADLDHDGHPDVIAPSQIGALFLRGKGDGTLSLPITAGGNAPFTAIADFDADGHPDIAWCTGVAYGDGSGEHWENLPISTGGGGVVAADFDGDGAMDFAVHRFPDRLETFLSRPNRTFQSIIGVAGLRQANSTMAMRVCDLNRDGRADIALLPNPSNGYVDFEALLGIGDGTFQYMPHPQSSPGGFGMGVADVTGDSIPDIVIAQRFSVALFRGHGDGTFAARQFVANDTLNERDLVIGDVTNDGIPDLVTTDNDRLLVRAGLGNGAFGPRIVSDVDLPLLGLELADMNGDGLLDVVTLCEATPGVVVVLGDGAGRFGTQPRIASPLDPRQVALGDVTGDGRLDIVTTAGMTSGSKVQVFRNEGSRNFSNPIVTALLDPGDRSSSSLLLADLNQDSKLDAVVNFVWSLQTALGNGDGTFGTLSSMEFSTYQTTLHIDDANGDSIPDMIGASANGLRVWPGIGDGTFGPATDSPLSARPVQIALGDLNHDGIVDVGLVLGYRVSHALGVGNGTFTADPTEWDPSPEQAGPTYVTIGDVTGDGRDDLIGMKSLPPDCFTTLLCSHLGSRIQGSSGSLGPWSAIPWMRGAHPRVADVNGDGAADLIYLTELGFAVAVSSPGGGFAIESGYGMSPFDWVLGDLDADGRLDITQSQQQWVTIHYGRDPFLVVGIPRPIAANAVGEPRILAAFPSPSGAEFHVRFRAKGPGPVTLSLFDVSGRCIRTLHSGVAKAGSVLESIASVADPGLTPGLYFLRLSSSFGVDTRRHIILR